MSTEHKFLIIKEVSLAKTSATKVYGVFSKSTGIRLGDIEWYPPWKLFTFNPEGNTVWSVDCLEYVNDYIKKLMTDKQRGV